MRVPVINAITYHEIAKNMAAKNLLIYEDTPYNFSKDERDYKLDTQIIFNGESEIVALKNKAPTSWLSEANKNVQNWKEMCSPPPIHTKDYLRR